MTTDASPARHAPAPTGGLDTPPSREQLDALARLLRAGSDPHRVAALLEAVSRRSTETAPCPDRIDEAGGAADLALLHALRPPAHRDLPAALLRITRAIDTETEPLYELQDTGAADAGPALRALAFRLLELGFTVAGHGGIDTHAIEDAVARAFGLPEPVLTVAGGAPR